MKIENRNKRITAMHICYLNPESPSGYETRVVEETQLLRLLRIRVIIACFIRRDHLFSIGRLWRFYRRLKRATGAKIYIIPTSRFFDLSVPPEGIKSITLTLVVLARLHGVDIMHGQALYTTMHALRARERTGAKVVFDVHGASPEETEMSGGHEGRVNRLTEWEREALDTVDLRVFVSNRMKNYFQEKYGLPEKPSVLIPCCVHNDRFTMSEEARNSKRAQLNINDKYVILYLGTLSAWQWPEAMFSLFAQFHQERPESLFYLLLPRSDHEKALSFVKKCGLPSESYMIEEVPHSKVGNIIGVADAGLLLRKSHPVNLVSSPTKFGEYLAAGIPVIATEGIGDTSALIRNENIGIIISASYDGISQDDLNRLFRFADDVIKNRAEWSRRCMSISQNVLEWNMRGKVLADAYGSLVDKGMADQIMKPQSIKAYQQPHITIESQTPRETRSDAIFNRNSNPIIVCGSARSGTTFVWNLLNTHPDIAISDEYFIYKTPSVITWFQEMSEALKTLYGRGNWAERKAQIMRMLWLYTGPSHLLEKGMTARRFGNKTPGAEHYIEFYDNVFEKILPLYVYVLREGKKVFLSVRNMTWGKNAHIKGQLKRYLDSIKIIEAYQKHHPERVYILQLDKIEPTYEAHLEITKKLLAFMGEEVVDEMLSTIRVWKPILSTKQVRRNDSHSIIKELPTDDEKFLDKNKEYQQVLEKYGYK